MNKFFSKSDFPKLVTALPAHRLHPKAVIPGGRGEAAFFQTTVQGRNLNGPASGDLPLLKKWLLDQAWQHRLEDIADID
jgi:hypothetical protein